MDSTQPKQSQRSQQINPSATLSITARANELQKEGIDVVNFGAGEPDFPTPDHIKEAGKNAITQNYTRYTSASGSPELKDAVRGKLERDQNLQYERTQISIGCGAKHVLFNVMASVIDPDDEVIIFSPYWVSYPNQIRYFGGVPSVVQTEETNFRPDLEVIEETASADTEILILNSPSNPTGQVIPREVVREIAQFCLEHDILLVSDEIYEKLIYDDRQHYSPAEGPEEIFQNTVIINGVSKAYAMTGWRIGYAAGPEEIISRMNTLMSHSTSNPTSISQKAAVEALKTPDHQIQDMVDTFSDRRDLIHNHLNNIDGISCTRPGGAFYAFPYVKPVIDRASGIKDDLELAETLIEEAHIAVVPGSPFGSPGYLRLSFANDSDRITLGLERLQDWVAEL